MKLGGLSQRILVVLFFVFLTLASFFVLAEGVNAACWCVTPEADSCDCTYVNGAGGRFDESDPCPIINKNPDFAPDGYVADPEFCDGVYHPVDVNGVAVVCNASFEANSYYATLSPICVLSQGPEIIPYCAPSADGNQNFVTCWGTQYILDDTQVPTDQDGKPIWNTGGVPINYNYGKGINYNGYTHEPDPNLWLVTCGSNLFCCGSNYCDDSVANTLGDSTSPNQQSLCQPSTTRDPRNPICGGAQNSPGESRIWFAQPRLLAGLTSLAQAMFNPFKLDELYQNSAFSKNAPPSNKSGVYTNPGAVTSRIEEHQGIEDSTPVVNTVDNNSSLIVGRAAPPPLYTFGNTSDDNIYNDNAACRIGGAVNNPGDDLIGPLVEAELFYTQKYVYRACPMPSDCVFDGEQSGEVLVTGVDPAIVDAEVTKLAENCCSKVSDDGIGDSECNADPRIVDRCEEPESQCPATGCPIGTSCINKICQNPTCVILPDGCAKLDPICYKDVFCGTLIDYFAKAEGKAAIFDKEPLIEYIYDNILKGTDSLYRKFMPLDFSDGPFEEKPSSSGYGATAIGYNQFNSPVPLKIGDGGTNSPTLFFPHLGTIYKYWLRDFQNTLRPQEFYESYETGTIPAPGGIILGTGTCTLGDQYCSVANLLPYFNNDPIKAANASQICNKESGENPLVVNHSCTYSYDGIDNDKDGCIDLNDAPGKTGTKGPCTPKIIGGKEYWFDGATLDFSVGLFQVNLLPRCPGAFSSYGWGPPPTCAIIDDGTDCTDLVSDLTRCNSKLRQCLINLRDPVVNINSAYAISNSGTNWCPWGVAPGCGLCP